MKSRDAGATITTNDGHVRLRIFDGVIPPDDYHREMAEAEAGQHRAARAEFLSARTRYEQRIAELEAALRVDHGTFAHIRNSCPFAAGDPLAEWDGVIRGRVDAIRKLLDPNT